MELQIDNCEDREFIQFLISYVQDWIHSNVVPEKFTKLDQCLEENYKGKLLKCMSILNAALNSMVVSRGINQNTYYIRFDSLKYYGNSGERLINLIKFINYGTLAVEGYPIIKNCFDTVCTQIDAIYALYRYGVKNE